mmetsp:Transcript_10092/g.36861  ORF Transcript_10092/g.36861 Transcript_10092/m.36861 type:complete len:156 (+) Transcript_10092:913-1380(+)
MDVGLQEKSYTTAFYSSDTELRRKKKEFAPARDLPFSFSGARHYDISSRGRGLIRLAYEKKSKRTRIIHYDEKTLYEWGVFRHFKGTILTTWFVWIQQLMLFTIATIVGYITWIVTTTEEAENVDYTALTTISSVVNTLVSFILALFLRRAVVIW